jgi:hypothetical protein
VPQINDVDGACPVCGNAMTITRLGCGRCGSALEGSFRLTGTSVAGVKTSGPLAPRGQIESRFGRLARLHDAQIEFVETFLRCRGVIKNVEDMLGISYPTVRARLNDVLDALGFTAEDDLPAPDDRRARREILADLAAGRISSDEAHRLLQRQPSPAPDAPDEGAPR